MKFKSQWQRQNEPVLPGYYSPGGGASAAIPDQSLSIREILRRSAAGIPMGAKQVPFFEPDLNNPMPDLTGLGPLERQEVIESIKTNLDGLKSKIQADRKSRAEALEEEKFQKRLKKETAALGIVPTNAPHSSNEGQGDTPKKLPAEGTAGGKKRLE
jgi:hypothetical protein